MWKVGRERTKESFHLGSIGAQRKKIVNLIFMVWKLWLYFNFHMNTGILRLNIDFSFPLLPGDGSRLHIVYYCC